MEKRPKDYVSSSQPTVQLPSILKPGGPTRQLPSAERKREIEKQLTSEVPSKHEIVGLLTVMDKNLDVAFSC